MRRRRFLTLPLAALLPGLARAQADGWPVRPVRLITPYGAGNVADHVARLLAEHLSTRWNQRVVVDNVPGAGGTIGASQIIRAAPDGHTLGLVAVAALGIVPHMTKATPYDPLRDLAPIAGVTASRGFVAVRSSLPVRSISELVAYAKTRPADRPLLYSSAGNGTIPHLNGEILRRALDFPAQHIPFRSSAAGVVEILAGRLDMTLDATSVTLPHIQAGTLRALAYNGPRRHPLLPDVPTVTETSPGLTLPNAWQSLFGPRALAPDLIARIARDIATALATPAFVDRLPPGTEPFIAGPKELAEQLRTDHERFGRLVAEIGLRGD